MASENVGAFYIETDRLKLFPAQPKFSKDINGLVLDSFDTLHPWMSFAQHRPTVDETEGFFKMVYENFLDKKGFHMAVFLKSENKFIGMVSADERNCPVEPIEGTIPYDVGYWLHKCYTGRGYASEAARGLIKYIQEEMKVDLFSICCLEKNVASSKVAENLNFRYISTSDLPLAHKRSDWPVRVLCKVYILDLK